MLTRPHLSFLICASLLLAPPTLAQTTTGTVTADQTGIPGVKISNGRDIAVTDDEGRYRIELNPGDTLFLIKPPDYAMPKGENGLPHFWRHHFPGESSALEYGGIPESEVLHADFTLIPDPSPNGPTQTLIFGDPQAKSQTDVGYYQKDMVEPIIGKHPARLGISLGDIVHDDLSLYPALNQVTARLETPWLHVAGNHDLDFDAGRDEDSLLSFRNTYGPDTFAWEETHAVFIGLDNVIYQPDQQPAYIGGLREDQFEFLEAYLPTVSPDRLLVLSAHIPFFDPDPSRETFRRADRERLFALLKDFPRVLLLTAHTHKQQHYFHGAGDGWHGHSPLREYNVGATCGGFWGGVKDAAGIPDAVMSDGTPNGYALLTVMPGGEYALRWYAARADDDYAIALHAPKVLRQGAWPGVYVYANVFMGAKDDRVEWRIGGDELQASEWRPMEHTEQPDPRILAENLADDAAETLRGYDRIPEAKSSTHLWRARLPTDLPAGEHRVEIRAFDRWRGELRAETHYRLVEVDPEVIDPAVK